MARELTMPRLSDSMEEGTIVKWLVAAGDELRAGQAIVEVETDKATVVHESDGPGILLGLIAGEGASVPVGAPIAVIGEAGESPPASAARQARGAVVGAAAVARPVARNGSASRVRASPLARRIAAQRGVDLAALAGSGPHGRVIRADVEHAAGAAGADDGVAVAADGGAHATPTTVDAAPAGGPAPDGATRGHVTRHELTRLQQTVARRMAESRAGVPDIELRSEVDMTEAVALREQLRGLAGDAPPSLNDLIVKAAALALRESPRVNGAYRDARWETHSRVNVGIAVAADDALVVPTILDADTQSLGTIARTTRTLASRVRDGSITPAELAGGTFSISNLGMHGVDGFSAVINAPQAAILAVGSLRRRPVVDDAGAIVARDTVQLSLACDHRIVYGVDAARFMARLRELLEHPLSLLL